MVTYYRYYFYFIIEHVLLYPFKTFGFQKDLHVQFSNNRPTYNFAKNGIFIQIEQIMTKKSYFQNECKNETRKPYISLGAFVCIKH